MAKNVKNGKLLYHITAMDNLNSILENGLLPRACLGNFCFNNIADMEIIESRKEFSLDDYVPFHFFSKTPFDYAVQHSYRDMSFIIIAIHRELAKKEEWSIIPKHPLSGDFSIYSYEKGFSLIDWDLLESDSWTYDTNSDYKLTCMAECLCRGVVTTDKFYCLYAKTDEQKNKSKKC